MKKAFLMKAHDKSRSLVVINYGGKDVKLLQDHYQSCRHFEYLMRLKTFLNVKYNRLSDRNSAAF